MHKCFFKSFNYISGLEPITTVAYTLDAHTILELLNRYPLNKSITIQNIESYFNYRTIGPDFKLVTSILSKYERFLDVQLRGYFKKKYFF